LADLEKKYQSQGYFSKYYPSEHEKVAEEQKEVIKSIIVQKIPPRQYYLSMTLCLISQKSYRYQFLKILS